MNYSTGLAALVLLLADGFCPAATNALRPWNDYRTIMWVSDSAYRQPEKVPLFFQRLREMGVNTAMVHGDGNLRPLLTNQFPYYVENMINRGLCLKFSSTVRDWDKTVTEWAKNGRPESALARDYCFDDPKWRDWARKEMQSLVRKNMGHQPLAYDLRDELSTTISANPFDYDFGPLALAGFREWLRTQYGLDIASLNAEWKTRFKSWEEVKPFTTDQIKNRMASGEAIPRGNPDWQAVQRIKFSPATASRQGTRWNLAPWCDFRTYMDISLARTLGGLREAARELDPKTPVGIEGTQMPSAFGGYDLWRLSRVLDWVEPYDIGNAREIFGSFMPGQPMMTTVFEKDTNHARRRLWHLLLEGDRGCIVWWSEDCIDWKSADYALTPKARALAPVLKEMTSPLAEIFLRAQRIRDPIFLLYSQPSIQVDWLIESTVDGSTWLRRFSSHESVHNRMARRRNAWLKLFQDLGYSPQFIPENAPSLNTRLSDAVLVLSDTLAMSAENAGQIESLIHCPPGLETRTVFASARPAEFDEHGKLRATNALSRIFPNPARTAASLRRRVGSPGPIVETKELDADIADYAGARLKPSSSPAQSGPDWPGWAAAQFTLPRTITLPAEARVRIHRFTLGDARLVAFERNIDYHMSEDLKQAGGNEALEKPVDLTATLDAPAHVYDLRSGKYLGHSARISFTLDPWQPSLFALLNSQPKGELFSELRKNF